MEINFNLISELAIVGNQQLQNKPLNKTSGSLAKDNHRDLDEVLKISDEANFQETATDSLWATLLFNVWLIKAGGVSPCGH